MQDIPPIARGEPLALLEIPAIGRSDIVVPGVTLNDLKDGPGHYPETPLPGQLGNASIAGHRTTYGAPFFDVDQLQPGDEIIVTMITGDRYVYIVTGSEIVSASDYWVVTTRDPTIAELTLTSCHPKYTAHDRIVVHSLLDPTRSSKVGFPTLALPISTPAPIQVTTGLIPVGRSTTATTTTRPASTTSTGHGGTPARHRQRTAGAEPDQLPAPATRRRSDDAVAAVTADPNPGPSGGPPTRSARAGSTIETPSHRSPCGRSY